APPPYVVIDSAPRWRSARSDRYCRWRSVTPATPTLTCVKATVAGKQRLLDWAPSAVLVPVGVAEVLTGQLSGAVRVQHLAAVLLCATVLAVRRRYPAAVALVISLAIVAVSLGGQPPDEVAALASAVIAAFAVGAYLGLRAAIAAALALSAAMVV